eukprot:g929.t1
MENDSRRRSSSISETISGAMRRVGLLRKSEDNSTSVNNTMDRSSPQLDYSSSTPDDKNAVNNTTNQVRTFSFLGSLLGGGVSSNNVSSPGQDTSSSVFSNSSVNRGRYRGAGTDPGLQQRMNHNKTTTVGGTQSAPYNNPKNTFQSPSKTSNVSSPNRPITYHTVARGDTVNSLALKYSMSARTFRRLNGLFSTKLYLGQMVRVYGGSTQTEAVLSTPEVTSKTPAEVPGNKLENHQTNTEKTKFQQGGKEPQVISNRQDAKKKNIDLSTELQREESFVMVSNSPMNTGASMKTHAPKISASKTAPKLPQNQPPPPPYPHPSNPNDNTYELPAKCFDAPSKSCRYGFLAVTQWALVFTSLPPSQTSSFQENHTSSHKTPPTNANTSSSWSSFIIDLRDLFDVSMIGFGEDLTNVTLQKFKTSESVELKKNSEKTNKDQVSSQEHGCDGALFQIFLKKKVEEQEEQNGLLAESCDQIFFILPASETPSFVKRVKDRIELAKVMGENETTQRQGKQENETQREGSMNDASRRKKAPSPPPSLTTLDRQTLSEHVTTLDSIQSLCASDQNETPMLWLGAEPLRLLKEWKSSEKVSEKNGTNATIEVKVKSTELKASTPEERRDSYGLVSVPKMIGGESELLTIAMTMAIERTTENDTVGFFSSEDWRLSETVRENSFFLVTHPGEIGVGGGDGGFAFQLNKDFRGVSNRSATFGNPRSLTSGETFDVRDVEVWALTSRSKPRIKHEKANVNYKWQ